MNPALRLLQLSDPHLFGSAEAELRGINTRASLAAVLRHARAQHWNNEAILLTGDLVNDDAGGYATLKDLVGNLGKPVWCLPGNHDDPAVMREELAAPPFSIGGHHDSGAWRVVLLDSCVRKKAYGRLPEAELRRLQNALSSAGNRHVLVALHHHPLPMGSRWIDSVALRHPEELFRITDCFACVRGIVWGHVHQSHDSRRKGVRLLATPSTCAQFLPGSANFAVDPAPPAYRRLILHPDGTIDTEVVRVDIATSAAQGTQRASGA